MKTIDANINFFNYNWVHNLLIIFFCTHNYTKHPFIATAKTALPFGSTYRQIYYTRNLSAIYWFGFLYRKTITILLMSHFVAIVHQIYYFLSYYLLTHELCSHIKDCNLSIPQFSATITTGSVMPSNTHRYTSIIKYLYYNPITILF